MLTFLIFNLKMLEAINIVDYMMADYPLAIRDSFEWEEMREFSRRLRELIPHNRALADSLILLVDRRADTNAVLSILENIRRGLISRSNLRMFPDGVVSLERGKDLYARECAVCHGHRGDGRGTVRGLDPPPASFVERDDLSPFRVYTVLHFGAAGMPAFHHLSDGDKWDVAFYVLSLRHEGLPGDTFYLPLELASVWSDRYMGEMGLKEGEVAFIRHNPGAGDTLSLILHTLHLIERTARSGNFTDALSILNGLYARYMEPVEKRMTDASRMEMDVMRLRRALEEGRTERVGRLVASLKEHFLSDEGDPPWHALIGSFVILFREGLEAILVIAIMLSVASVYGNRRVVGAVHAGWAIAILSGFITWILFRRVLSGLSVYGEILEGLTSFVAAAILLYVALWFSSGTVESLRKRMREASQRRAWIGAFALSFLVVYREAFETVLFYSALYESADRGGVIGGFLMGLITIILLGIAVFHLHRRLPLRQIFTATSWMLLALALVFIGKGIREIQEVGMLPVHFLDYAPHIDLLGIYPTLEGLVSQGAVALLSIYLIARRLRLSEDS